MTAELRPVDVILDALNRRNRSPIDHAHDFADLGHGMSQHGATDASGFSQGTISQRLALLTLPREMQAAVDDGRLRLREAWEHARDRRGPAHTDAANLALRSGPVRCAAPITS